MRHAPPSSACRLSSSSPPPGAAEIKWKSKSGWPATWSGGADASGLPHGHGVLVWDGGEVSEGTMDHGRREGLWVQKSADGRSWSSFQFTGDVGRDEKVRLETTRQPRLATSAEMPRCALKRHDS